MTLPYFAYGSNLSADHWASWCAARGLSGAALVPLERAWLPDHTLAFNYFSQAHQAGAANVMPAPGQLVPGVLFSATPEAWAALDRKEGHPHTYARTERTVLLDGGREARAITYVVTEAKQRPFTAPTAAYLERIRAGYRDWGLTGEAGMLEAVAAQRPVPRSVPALFVYGTLMSGQAAEHKLAPFGVVSRTPVEIPGALWDFGDWPGAIFWPPPEGTVRGERVVLSDPAPAFSVLDPFEEFPGWASAGGTYRRVLVTAGGQRAWAYQIQDVSGAQPVAGGDWRTTR